MFRMGGESIKNVFYFFLNESINLNDIRTSNLFVDYDYMVDPESAFIAMPCND